MVILDSFLHLLQKLLDCLLVRSFTVKFRIPLHEGNAFTFNRVCNNYGRPIPHVLSSIQGVNNLSKVVSVNLTGVFLCARTAARQMIKQGGGKVVNIASIYGAVGDVFPASPYYATKGAVINMTRDLAVEWAPFKIRVNAIAPGFFPSEMTEAIFQDPGYLEYIRKQTPLGRPGNPDDLKGAVVYLASPASDYVTGQTIFVDGGWTAW